MKKFICIFLLFSSFPAFTDLSGNETRVGPGYSYLDETPLGQVMNVSGELTEIDVKAVKRELQQLKPEETSTYLNNMKTKSGKTFLQVLVVSKLTEKVLFQQILQIIMKLEYQGWSMHKIIKTLYSDKIFIKELLQYYPRIHKILKKAKILAYTWYALTTTQKFAWGAIPGLFSMIFFDTISRELGFMDLAEIVVEATPYVMATTGISAATIGANSKLVRKVMPCYTTFSALFSQFE